MLSENNSREFWRLVNAFKTNRSCMSNEISASEWLQHFQNLNKMNFSASKLSDETKIVND